MHIFVHVFGSMCVGRDARLYNWDNQRVDVTIRRKASIDRHTAGWLVGCVAG